LTGDVEQNISFEFSAGATAAAAKSDKLFPK
jgi:hypothetical protein